MEKFVREPDILLAEDDSATGLLMMEFLMSKSFTPDLAENGEEALKLFENNNYDIVITDIEMPKMNGVELIKRIKKIAPDTLIIITSVHRESSLIIETMKLGAYDYLIKPVDLNDLAIKLNHALEQITLKRQQAAIEKEREIRNERILDWYRFEDRMKQHLHDSTNKSLFQGISKSFSQGAGIGVLVSLLDVLNIASKEYDEKSLLVDKDLMEAIQANNKHVSHIIERFNNIVILEDRKLEHQEITVDELYDKIMEACETNKAYVSRKKSSFTISNKKPEFASMKILCNLDYFMEAANELLINAIKYSLPDEKITVLLNADKELSIMILNTPLIERDGVIGIPVEYEKLVFEPFFRISNNLHEEFDTMEYGIGLTYCEKIVKDIGGNISLYNILDRSDIKEGMLKVCCELTVPLVS